MKALAYLGGLSAGAGLIMHAGTEKTLEAGGVGLGLLIFGVFLACIAMIFK